MLITGRVRCDHAHDDHDTEYLSGDKAGESANKRNFLHYLIVHKVLMRSIGMALSPGMVKPNAKMSATGGFFSLVAPCFFLPLNLNFSMYKSSTPFQGRKDGRLSPPPLGVFFALNFRPWRFLSIGPGNGRDMLELGAARQVLESTDRQLQEDFMALVHV
jgi:hypothetical protein